MRIIYRTNLKQITAFVPIFRYIFSRYFKVARQALKIINPQFSRPLHVSFDIDVLDPSEAPATGTPGDFGNQYN